MSRKFVKRKMIEKKVKVVLFEKNCKTDRYNQNHTILAY